MTAAATFPTVIDSTMRSSFLLCPHHFFRRYCQGLQHAEAATSIHLHFGGALARGLEIARRTYYGGETPQRAAIAGTEALIQYWGDVAMPDNPSRTEAAKSLDACILALQDYLIEWPLATDPVQIAHFGDKPCIEFRGHLPIPGCLHPETGEPLLYGGRFDMVGTYGGSYWGLDDKTTGFVAASWADQWRLRGQFTGYAWLVRAYAMPVLGMLVRGICPLKGGTKLVPTVEIPQPEWAVQRWLAQLRRDVQHMLFYWAQWETLGAPFSQILDAGCYNYNRACEFMPLCTSPQPERWESEYVVQRWDPLGE